MRATTSLLATLAIAGSFVSAADVLTPQLADAFAKKIVLVQKQGEEKAFKARPTAFTQAETNSYLKFQAGDLLPTGGIVDVWTEGVLQ